MSAVVDPLGPPPAEIPLRNAPLVRVIAQLRFPEILSIERRDFVAPFQEAIRAEYPVLRQEQTQVLFSVGGGVVAPPKPQTAWRFADVEGLWRVSLTPGFLALETTKYTSRSDFLKRFRSVVEALDEHIEPKVVDRLGIRYIDRIVGADVDEIGTLVIPEVRGIVGSAVASRARQMLSETIFMLDDAGVRARWGSLPEGETIDLAAIEPAAERSWILDLDMFSTTRIPFEVERVLAQAQQFAERIYTFFRWAVTDDFLKKYGGNP
jgi:uncharacterized protein (TIGR04255 family)